MWLRAMKFIEGLFLTLQLAEQSFTLQTPAMRFDVPNAMWKTDMRNGHAGCRVIRQT